MSHFGRSGPPDIRDTYSLLVLNITFRTSADDLFPLFDRYGKVVDIFIPRDRRTGDSRGFAFFRYKYADEAQKAVERLDGKNVDGRYIMVQFAKYGPNAERIQRGRITTSSPKPKAGRSRSRSPPPRHRNSSDNRDREYGRRGSVRDRYERDEYRDKDRDYHRRSPSQSPSPRRERSRTRSPRRVRSRSTSILSDEPRRRSRSRSLESRSPARPARRNQTPRRSLSPRPRSPAQSPAARSPDRANMSPNGKHRSDSRSASPLNSDAEH
uniref:RRM domain-containing protein n=1 Tax=Picea sitchensis TaxID=3332 RepID=B8LQW7_PICSI|nr:unknown [Picea sitchensis]